MILLVLCSSIHRAAGQFFPVKYCIIKVSKFPTMCQVFLISILLHLQISVILGLSTSLLSSLTIATNIKSFIPPSCKDSILDAICGIRYDRCTDLHEMEDKKDWKRLSTKDSINTITRKKRRTWW
ncbi:hypothetical protein DL96DRAFT_1683941 [Flagelloscypha sp. PMI_526]|nr:hypothetical protein DL96DRAFT_1683941 [Flagelloscypha sp. PMI_526]